MESGKHQSGTGMTLATRIGQRGTRWVLVWIIWTALGLSFAGQFYLSSARLGRPITWGYAVNYALCDWYVFALLSLPVVWLSRRWPIDRGTWRTSAPLHLAGSALFSLAYVVIRTSVEVIQEWFAGQTILFAAAFQPLLVKSFHYNLLIYWVILTVCHALDFYQQAQDRELRASELEKHLAEARLQALQMQLNPHFLFNTLHAISALMHQDVEAADRMIARLSDLLRYALESTEAQEVPLRKELAFLDRYLEIEQTRFGDRLIVQKQIDPQTLDLNVPNLILQPLLENAIRHGIEPHARKGKIVLTARRETDRLRLEVWDNGAGLHQEHDQANEGVGLSNTRARLEELYGSEYRLELKNAPEGGLVVRVEIPYEMTPGQSEDGFANSELKL